MRAISVRSLLLLLAMTWMGALNGGHAMRAATDQDGTIPDLADWYQGPMRYLLRGAEVDLFRSLDSD